MGPWANLITGPSFSSSAKALLATWPSGTARRWQILRDGFDSRLEPIAFGM